MEPFEVAALETSFYKPVLIIINFELPKRSLYTWK